MSVVCVFLFVFAVLVITKVAELNAMTHDRLPPIRFSPEEAE